jgi:hypothetical protein
MIMRHIDAMGSVSSKKCGPSLHGVAFHGDAIVDHPIFIRRSRQVQHLALGQKPLAEGGIRQILDREVCLGREGRSDDMATWVHESATGTSRFVHCSGFGRTER